MPATQWKIPPLIKAYEALGAIGDGRVRIEGERRATVTSSDGSKTYEVETSADGHEIASNDNASYWQGYVRYPAIDMTTEFVDALEASRAYEANLKVLQTLRQELEQTLNLIKY